MTYPKIESWRDNFDLEPNTHPAIAHALQHMRTNRAAKLTNDAARWPFPAHPIPPDYRHPPPARPDPEDALL